MRRWTPSRIQILRDQIEIYRKDGGRQRGHGVRHIIGPSNLFCREVPNYNPFPFGQKLHIAQLIRHILLSEPLVDEVAESFRGVTAQQVDHLMESFLFNAVGTCKNPRRSSKAPGVRRRSTRNLLDLFRKVRRHDRGRRVEFRKTLSISPELVGLPPG